jgi:hypothetical protein
MWSSEMHALLNIAPICPLQYPLQYVKEKQERDFSQLTPFSAAESNSQA